jgi:subtilisin family serine protease
MAVRIIGNEQAGFLSDAVAGIQYAVDNGARVLSNSWRIYRSWDNYDPSEQNVELLRKAIEYAHSKGAIFVAAAGNETVNLDTDEANDPIYPAGYQNLPGLVVVASSDVRNAMSSFSNYGANYVNVAAPGSDIISTTPGNQWESFSGTSMATPLVAGALARGLSGTMDPVMAVEKISATSTPGASWTGKVKSGGIVNLGQFLAP